MPHHFCSARRFSLSGLLVVALPAAVFGQAPPAGVRAAGMAGAFTAVADDASATVWNPAGLATGAFFGLTLDSSFFQAPSSDPNRRLPVSLAAISTPILGFSYVRETAPAGSVPGIATGRNFVTDSAGVSLAQSLGPAAAGATGRWVHDEASGANAFDLDLGVMASGGLGRIGVTARHLFAPQLGSATLARAVRGGVALNAGDTTTVAADVDFTTLHGVSGDWREAAIGVEHRPSSRLALRGGLHWNTAGASAGAAPIASLGAGVAVFGTVTLDVQGSFGSNHGSRGWGAGLRYVF